METFVIPLTNISGEEFVPGLRGRADAESPILAGCDALSALILLLLWAELTLIYVAGKL